MINAKRTGCLARAPNRYVPLSQRVLSDTSRPDSTPAPLSERGQDSRKRKRSEGGEDGTERREQLNAKMLHNKPLVSPTGRIIIQGKIIKNHDHHPRPCPYTPPPLTYPHKPASMSVYITNTQLNFQITQICTLQM